MSEAWGTVQLRDKHGNLHEVNGRTRPGASPILAGSKVLLLEYDETKGVFIVVRLSDLDERLAS